MGVPEAAGWFDASRYFVRAVGDFLMFDGLTDIAGCKGHTGLPHRA
jgi:hypothetical protein